MSKIFAALVGALLLAAASVGTAPAASQDPKLGLISDSAVGELRYLVIVVDFPDVQPRFNLEQIRERAVTKTARWYQAASYGQTHLRGALCGPFTLPQPLEAYQVSPYNFQVSSERVYALVRDALSLAEEHGADLAQQDVIAVVHRAFTMPGQGYGMICYCANPGMISKVRNGRARYVEIQTRRGSVYQKGVVVMAENFHVGFMTHDLAHAIGGAHEGTRLVQDLYDFELQSRPRSRFQIHDAAVYVGPWDLMSQHFITPRQPSPGFSLFTMIRLGYIRPEQVKLAPPGRATLARLAPLAQGGKTVGIKIALDQTRYLLVENRQPLRVDRVLPAGGVMIYQVDLERQEGAGQVRAVKADPQAPDFSRAPFGVEDQAAAVFLDQEAGWVIAALAKLGQDYLVLVAPADQADPVRRIAAGLQKMRGQAQFPQRLRQVTGLIKQGSLPKAARQAQQ